jgi:hypothetical protein
MHATNENRSAFACGVASGRLFRKLCLAATLLVGSLTPAVADELPAVDYLRDVKPVLQARCYACHGAQKQQSGLRVDTAVTIQAGGESGSAIVPGNAAESLIVAAVTGDGMERMPKEGQPLSDEQIPNCAWIDAIPGRPTKSRPPTLALTGRFSRRAVCQHPVRPILIGARIPSTLFWRPSTPAAHRRPRSAASRAVAASSIPSAFRPRATSCTTSPTARRTPDGWSNGCWPARYTPSGPATGWTCGRCSGWDSFSAELRRTSRSSRWRDWIVESLAADRPYEQMVREMLAGDELAPDDESTLRATGYLVRNWYMFNRNVWLDNTVEHTAKAFLGLTINCARCHDHKYDPIAQTDYYRFRAFFEPHQVRFDRPGPRYRKDGVVRVRRRHCCNHVSVPSRRRQAAGQGTSARQAAARCAALAHVEPVPLPATAYYPGVRSFVQSETLAQAESRVAQARAALTDAAGKPDDGAGQRRALAIAEREVAAADAQQAFTQARIVACSTCRNRRTRGNVARSRIG